MKITIKNIIKENIDPEEKYINKLSDILKPPYFYNLIVTETPENLWSRILSKVFNQEVTHHIWVNNDNNIFNSNNYLIYKEDSNGYWEKYEYDSNNNQNYNENSDGDWYKREYDSNNNQIYYEDNNGYWIKREYDSNGNRIYYENSDGEIIDRRSSNTINENIDPEEKYINKLSGILKPPYFYNLIVTETPENLWSRILSKIFNQEVTLINNKIYDSNDNLIYYEDSNGYWYKQEYDSNNNLIYYEDSNGDWDETEYDFIGNLIYYENSDGVIIDRRSSNTINENIDPEEKYINKLSDILTLPYFYNLIVTETPTYLWNKILSKISNQEVTYNVIRNGDDRINRIYDSNNNQIYYEDSNGDWEKHEYDSNGKRIYYENNNGVIIDRRSSNTINENIDPEEKYINKLSNILKPPYFYNLKVTETPTYLWNKILSKIFNQEVTQYFAVNSDNLIFNSNGNVVYREYSNGYWEKREYNSKGNLIYYENSDGYWEKREYESKGNLIYYGNSDGEIKEYDSNGNRIYSENSDGYWVKHEYDSNNKLIYYEDSNGEIRGNRSSNTINEYGQF